MDSTTFTEKIVGTLLEVRQGKATIGLKIRTGIGERVFYLPSPGPDLVGGNWERRLGTEITLITTIVIE